MPIERFHGKNLKIEDIAREQADLEAQRNIQFERLKAKEVRRTEWQEEMIRLSDRMIRQECDELGIAEATGLSPERHVFLSPNDFAEATKHQPAVGAMHSSLFRFAIFNSETPRNRLFTEQLHEAIHGYSFDDTLVISDHDAVATRRSGIEIFYPAQSVAFRGANEATTERLRWRLCGIHREEIRSSLGFSEEEMRDITHRYEYPEFIECLDQVNEHVALARSVSSDRIWDLWTAAMLTGEMMELRQVERAWGEGALRILSMLGYDKQLDARVFTFFGTMSYGAAEKIRKELLNA
jgi:hypothetical protein